MKRKLKIKNAKLKIITRIRRIKGQAEGIERMIKK